MPKPKNIKKLSLILTLFSANLKIYNNEVHFMFKKKIVKEFLPSTKNYFSLPMLLKKKPSCSLIVGILTI